MPLPGPQTLAYQTPADVIGYGGSAGGGKTDLAIYAWDGANLKLCWVKDGDKHPTDFATKPGDKRVLLILKRQDP